MEGISAKGQTFERRRIEQSPPQVWNTLRLLVFPIPVTRVKLVFPQDVLRAGNLHSGPVAVGRLGLSRGGRGDFRPGPPVCRFPRLRFVKLQLTAGKEIGWKGVAFVCKSSMGTRCKIRLDKTSGSLGHFF